jgi:hypothetical protein
MSNQFSYELDERQIRIMLRDGEMENDPAAWNRFEQLAQPDVKPKQASFSPRFNVSISRSVLVPLIFVVLIGGLSATLFSFVDFKKKDAKITKAVPEQKSQETPATIQAQPVTDLSAIPEKVASTPVENTTAAPTPTVQQATLTQTETKQAVQKTETKPAETAPSKTSTSGQVVTATTAPSVVTAANTTPHQQPVVKKRKQKKVVSEEIPTINASSTNLNQENQEPELELR